MTRYYLLEGEDQERMLRQCLMIKNAEIALRYYLGTQPHFPCCRPTQRLDRRLSFQTRENRSGLNLFWLALVSFARLKPEATSPTARLLHDSIFDNSNPTMNPLPSAFTTLLLLL